MKAPISIVFLLLISSMIRSQSEITLGVEIGQSLIIGDIESLFFNGYSSEVYLKKSIHKYINYEPTIHISQNYGLSKDLFAADQISSTKWFPAYKNTSIILFQSISSSLIIISDRLIFEPKIGIGLGTSKARFNVLDQDLQPYNNIDIESGFTTNNLNYLNNVKEIHDDSYETSAFQNKGLFGVGDERIDMYYTVGARIVYDLSNSISIGLSQSYILSNSDYLDGIKFKNDIIRTNGNDVIQSSKILLQYRFNFNRYATK